MGPREAEFAEGLMLDRDRGLWWCGGRPQALVGPSYPKSHVEFGGVGGREGLDLGFRNPERQ